MLRKVILGALVLFAGAAYAQPQPTRHPPKYTVATAPSCVDAEPKLFAVTDGASATDCAVGGGSADVICKCIDGVASAVGSGGGGGVNDGDKGDITVSGSGATWTIDGDSVALGTDTTGGYAASVSEAGPATTATALAADPADCSANQFANAIAASGALTCAAISDADVPDGITVTLAGTATALAANGANCSAGQYPLGVDASGASESCTADDDLPDADEVTEAMLKAVNTPTDEYLLTYESTAGDFEWAQHAPTASALAANGANCSAGQYPLGVDASGAAESCTADDDLPDADEVTEAMLKAVDAAGDEECLTYESTAGDFEWQTCASAGIGGSTGATDNAMLAADGTGGATLQARDLTISDVAAGVVTLATTAGNALAIANTNPAATTGASVAGDPLTISAGNAVASTDTAGAAAGGDVTITAGSAARNTSGSANGGNINLNAGATIGGAFNGQILIGTTGAWNRPSVSFPTSTTTGFYLSAANMFTISGGGVGYNFSSTALSSANTPLFYGFKDLVEANTAGSGTPNAIAATETGTVFTNEGVTAANHHTLPSAAAGYQFTFVVQDADGLRIIANTGDDIHIGATVSSAAGYCESSTVGDSVTLVSINAVSYYAVALIGSGWTCA